MKNKSKILSLIVLACVVALYNLILFISVSNVEKTAVFWISYAFIMVSVIPMFVLVLIKNPFSDGTKVTLNVPLIRFAITYAVIEFLVGTLFMIIQNKANVKVALILQIVILVVMVIIALLYCLSANRISQNYETQKNDVLSQNMLYVQVSSLASSIAVPALVEKMGEIADKIKFSDFNAYPELADQDQTIRATVMQLKVTTDENLLSTLVTQLERLVDERNEMCKYIKKKRG